MDNYALKINKLVAAYGNNIILNNIDLQIKTGEYTAIIGPNGGGKTTLLKSILHLIDLKKGDINLFNNKIAYVPQANNLDKDFPISVFECVRQGTFDKDSNKIFYKFKKDSTAKTLAVLKQVNITNLKDHKLNELSGGEFQKVMIARALASEANILVLDEPTANIDPASRSSIYELLNSIKGHTTILMATHDLFAVSSFVDRIVCIDHGIVYHGKPELAEDIVDRMYGCPVDLIAHGVPHRVMSDHTKEGL